MESRGILVIEDDMLIRRALEESLGQQGYVVYGASLGREGLELFGSRSPCLVLLDLMLPDLDGLEVCGQIRRLSDVPIIILTAKSQEVDVVLGFERGADDYITKPFSMRELLLRIRAILRRVGVLGGGGCRGGVYEFGGVRVDLEAMEICRDGKVYSISPLEREVLKMLLENGDRVVSRNAFLNRIWGYESYPTTRTIDFHISRLRNKIERDPSRPEYILTVHGVGYKFRGKFSG